VKGRERDCPPVGKLKGIKFKGQGERDRLY